MLGTFKTLYEELATFELLENLETRTLEIELDQELQGSWKIEILKSLEILKP